MDGGVTSEEVGTTVFGEDYFKRKPVQWLKSFLRERGIQTSCDGKNKRKAELVELSFKACKLDLPNLEKSAHEDEGDILSELFRM